MQKLIFKCDDKTIIYNCDFCLIDDKGLLEQLDVDIEDNVFTQGKRESFPDGIMLEKRKAARGKREEALKKRQQKEIWKMQLLIIILYLVTTRS